jgi:catechol 2,3-dioxygenase-like lactoylglutathione lyase family enzyme
MIKLTGIGHVNLRVADQEASKRFYSDVLGFLIAEEDPDHGGVFMTLGDRRTRRARNAGKSGSHTSRSRSAAIRRFEMPMTT